MVVEFVPGAFSDRWPLPVVQDLALEEKGQVLEWVRGETSE